MSKIDIMCKYLGGSHLYGLNTPSSDTDERGVFCNTEPAQILGLDVQEHQRKQDADSDIVLFEIRRWMELLRKSNTESVDALFVEKWTIEPDNIMLECIKNRHRLFDSKRLIKSILGYMIGELRLAVGERTGVLGAKRRVALEKYGYSPKNFVQLFRLYHLARGVCCENRYILDCTNEPYFEKLMRIKTEPQKYDVEKLKTDANMAIHDLRNAEVMIDKNTFASFDQAYANDILHRCYKKYLC